MLKHERVGDLQARNFMRDMKVGQRAFFYHSNCKEPGIAGIIQVSVYRELDRNAPLIDFFWKITSVSLVFQVVKEAYVDHTQFDKSDVHYDPSSKPENPKWSMVESRNITADQCNRVCTAVLMKQHGGNLQSSNANFFVFCFFSEADY